LTGELAGRGLGVLDVAGVLPAIRTADAAQPSLDGGPGRGQGDVPGRLVPGAERRQEPTDKLDLVALGGGVAARRAVRLLVHIPRTLFSFRPILPGSFLPRSNRAECRGARALGSIPRINSARDGTTGYPIFFFLPIRRFPSFAGTRYFYFASSSNDPPSKRSALVLQEEITVRSVIKASIFVLLISIA